MYNHAPLKKYALRNYNICGFNCMLLLSMGVNQFWTDLIFEIFALNEIDVKHKINIAGLNYWTSSHTLNVKNDPGVYSLKKRSFSPHLFIQTKLLQFIYQYRPMKLTRGPWATSVTWVSVSCIISLVFF